MNDHRLPVIKYLEENYATTFNRKKRRKLLEMSDLDFDSHSLGMEISACLKSLNLDSAYSSYGMYREKGVYPTPTDFLNILCLAAGLGDQGSGSNPRLQSPPQDIDKTMAIFDDMKRKGLDLNEAAYTAVIRCLCHHNQVDKALDLYYEMINAKQIEPKLRTISLLLQVLAGRRDKTHCEDIFPHIQRYNLTCTEKEYASMLLLYHTLDLDEEFLQCLSTMSEDILRIALTTTLDTIQSFFTKHQCYAQEAHVDNTNGLIQLNQELGQNVALKSIDLSQESKSLLLTQLSTLAINRDSQAPTQSQAQAQTADVKPIEMQEHSTDVNLVANVNKRHKPNNKIKEQYQVHQSSSSVKNVSSSIHNQLCTSIVPNHHKVTNIDSIDTTNTRISHTHRKDTNLSQVRGEIWSDFTSWLEKIRDEYAFNLILDGANVGYYKQNYANAPLHISYEQIHYIYHILNRISKWNQEHHREPLVPLIILHSRHISPTLLPTVQVYKDLMSTWPVYYTPKNFNDDWFWLYAAIKYNTKVLTNDDMRDHHFQFLSPKYFIRWRENSRVMYEMFSSRNNPTNMNGPLHQNMVIRMTACSADRNTITHHIQSDDRSVKVILKFPLPYSYRIQHIQSDSMDVWLFPPLGEPSAPHSKQKSAEKKEEKAEFEDSLDLHDYVKDAKNVDSEGDDGKWVCFVRYSEAISAEERRDEMSNKGKLDS